MGQSLPAKQVLEQLQKLTTKQAACFV